MKNSFGRSIVKTEAEFNEAFARWDAKEDADWYEFTADEIKKAFSNISENTSRSTQEEPV